MVAIVSRGEWTTEEGGSFLPAQPSSSSAPSFPRESCTRLAPPIRHSSRPFPSPPRRISRRRMKRPTSFRSENRSRSFPIDVYNIETENNCPIEENRSLATWTRSVSREKLVVVVVLFLEKPRSSDPTIVVVGWRSRRPWTTSRAIYGRAAFRHFVESPTPKIKRKRKYIYIDSPHFESHHDFDSLPLCTLIESSGYRSSHLPREEGVPGRWPLFIPAGIKDAEFARFSGRR